MWRRLTRSAVIIQVFICILIYAIIPNLFQGLESTKYHDPFLKETNAKAVTITTKALLKDVEEGRAEFAGQVIQKQHIKEPVGIYFEKVARINPSNPKSAKVGLGRFHAEIWVLSWFGIEFSNFSKPQLVAVRFFFDALFPFVLLFLLSFITRPVAKPYLDRFFAKMHTPVQKSAAEEKKALEDSYANPNKFKKDKLFPNSHWEIMKPSKMDFIGFGGSWILVAGVIFLLWVIVSIK